MRKLYRTNPSVVFSPVLHNIIVILDGSQRDNIIFGKSTVPPQWSISASQYNIIYLNNTYLITKYFLYRNKNSKGLRFDVLVRKNFGTGVPDGCELVCRVRARVFERKKLQRKLNVYRFEKTNRTESTKNSTKLFCYLVPPWQINEFLFFRKFYSFRFGFYTHASPWTIVNAQFLASDQLHWRPLMFTFVLMVL